MVCYRQGHIQGGGLSARHPLSDFEGGGLPPLDFQNLKRKNTATHHSNRKRDKGEVGKRRKYIAS